MRAVLFWFALVSPAAAFDTLEELGGGLFFDTNLSLNRTQNCASCHDPANGFVDSSGPVSVGDDGVSLGTRNAPTITYAAEAPPFEQLDEHVWRGGQFWDGRAADLAAQAGGPPLNPVEMAMPDKASVVARLRENLDYVDAFDLLFAPGVLDDPEAGFAAMTQAIAAFESTPEFAPYDSKYDLFLRGEAELSELEEIGRQIFLSPERSNCALCHMRHMNPMAPGETFTNYEYHNIGVPRVGDGAPDWGLLSRDDLKDPALGGQFKVPTLRNVAVTGPYMHNGVFTDLRSVVQFYNRYQCPGPPCQINPETGRYWGDPPIPMTLSVSELTEGRMLGRFEVDALVAFLKTLTDARYEHLLVD
ncbi:cytochrome c peroxidase [Aliiroseovarius subalbicans]|uniref:cytochrome-c peroxidase n=1 Tax=Aliiroseovarius subalbicans TaxID=2925840 RepID=UPI001F59931C|nr:cytochrome c peroxidase [Aliiroseovarius subalbicans]MCI2400631.1 methylamine utilization protein MauG [Aliiroseovarius subalbicans]